jgi:hypothetical protein
MLQARYIKCGKNCKKCPHGTYLYAKHREGNTVKSMYIGKVGETSTLKKLNKLAKTYPKVIEEYERISSGITKQE